jgi:hypothetical protein
MKSKDGGIKFTDRYQALGIPYPDPKTVCKGHCEGTGMYPLFILISTPKIEQVSVRRDYLPSELEAWRECHKECNFLRRLISRMRHMEWWYWKSLFEPCDGWHFIKCSDCNGTGKAS